MSDRLFITHLFTGDSVSAQFNPFQFEEEIESLYKRIGVAGASGEPLEYDHTKNYVCNFDLGFDATSARDVSIGGSLPQSNFFPAENVRLARRFMLACCHPMRAKAHRLSAPSPLLLVWPGFVSLRVRLLKVKNTITQWAATDGPPVMWSTSCDFEHDHRYRLYYEDVLEHGTEFDAASMPDLGENF